MEKLKDAAVGFCELDGLTEGRVGWGESGSARRRYGGKIWEVDVCLSSSRGCSAGFTVEGNVLVRE